MSAARRKFAFGYPDGYGAALYPPAYDATVSATAFLQYQFRAEQQDKAPPDTALVDKSGDLAQKEYKAKYPPADLPPHSGLSSYKGFGYKDGIGYIFFQSEPTGPGVYSFKEWLRKNNINPDKFPK